MVTTDRSENWAHDKRAQRSFLLKNNDVAINVNN